MYHSRTELVPACRCPTGIEPSFRGGKPPTSQLQPRQMSRHTTGVQTPGTVTYPSTRCSNLSSSAIVVGMTLSLDGQGSTSRHTFVMGQWDTHPVRYPQHDMSQGTTCWPNVAGCRLPQWHSRMATTGVLALPCPALPDHRQEAAAAQPPSATVLAVLAALWTQQALGPTPCLTLTCGSGRC